MALANYMQGFLGRRTAAYEYNSSSDFAKLYDCCHSKHMVDGQECFSYKSVDYYMKKSTELMKLVNQDYDVVIVDCGSSMTAMAEFMRCDYKIVISSLQLWHSERYGQFCDRLADYSGSDTWLHILGGDVAQIKHIRKSYGISATKRPCIDNAFIIDGALIEFFQTLFA